MVVKRSMAYSKGEWLSTIVRKNRGHQGPAADANEDVGRDDNGEEAESNTGAASISVAAERKVGSTCEASGPAAGRGW